MFLLTTVTLSDRSSLFWFQIIGISSRDCNRARIKQSLLSAPQTARWSSFSHYFNTPFNTLSVKWKTFKLRYRRRMTTNKRIELFFR